MPPIRTVIRPDSKAFKPAWWIKNSHIQSIWPYLFQHRETFDYQTEVFELVDGDFVEGMWIGQSSGPILIILHGLEGSIDSYYANSLCHAVDQFGWRALFLHFRNCSKVSNRLNRLYHMGDTGDLLNVVSIIKHREPKTSLAAVGFSMGANVLTKWVGEMKDRCPLSAAVSVCNPFDIDIASRTINQSRFGRFYEKTLLGFMKKGISKKHGSSFQPNIDKAVRCKSFREFDSLITVPLHGFTSLDEYYKLSSSKAYLQGIKKPMLFINAMDDPLVNPKSLPHTSLFPSHTTVEYHKHGGHVGFFTIENWKQPLKLTSWLDTKILNFLYPYLYETKNLKADASLRQDSIDITMDSH